LKISKIKKQGGEAVFLHTNYIVDKYFDLEQTNVVAMPDVGFFWIIMVGKE